VLKRGNWKSLLDNMFLDGATRDVKGGGEAYKLASRNTLGGQLVFARFFYKKKGTFAKDPCFMVIAFPSTGMGGPTLTLVSDEVWGEDKLVHLSGLPVTNTYNDPLSHVCGTVGSECLLGLYLVPVRDSILKTPLVWCMNEDVVFSVGSSPHKGSVDNEITGWLSVSKPKEMEYHREISFPAFSDEVEDTSVFDLLVMALPLPFNQGIPDGYAMSGKITAETMIEGWNVFAGPGENSHQWIDTPFFHRWEAVMTDGGKWLALCWGQTGTYNMEPRVSQGPWPLRTAALSCYWKLWLEDLERGLEVNQGQEWEDVTTQAMASIPKDVRDDRDILSMTDLLALTDSPPPEQCYPNALLNQFDSKLAFGDTKSSMDERAGRATTMLAIAPARRASPTRSRGHPSAPHKATHGSPSAVYLRGCFTPDTTLGSLPAAGEGIIPHFPGYDERDMTVSFKDSLAEHSDIDSIEAVHTVQCGVHTWNGGHSTSSACFLVGVAATG
jgi:hypothetical protein